MIAGVFDWVPNPIDVVTAPYRWGFDALKSAGSDVIREAFQWVAGLLLSGVSWLFTVVWTLVSEATTPDLYASWFADGPYRVMTTLAAAILMLAVMLAIAETLWNRDGAGLLRAVAQDFPKAVFILTGLLFLTTLGLAVADGVTDWLLGMFSGGAADFAEAMANVAGELQFGAGLFVVMLTAFGLMVILGLVTVMLVFREGFIFFLTAVTAVMVVLDVYRPTRGAGGRSIRLLAGVIVAKPVIALCFALAGAMLGSIDTAKQADGAIAEPGAAAATDPATGEAMLGEGSDDLAQTFGTLLAGLATMAMAAVAPFSVLKLFPVAEAAAAESGQRAVTGKAVVAAHTGMAVVTGGTTATAGGASAASTGAAAGATGSAATNPATASSAAQKAG